MTKPQPKLQTHTTDHVDFQERFEKIRARLVAAGDTQFGPLNEKLELLKAMSEFDYGRHLLVNGGLSGRWSHYAFYEYSRLKVAGHKFHPTEVRLLEMAGMASQRERLDISQALIKQSLCEGIQMLSVPCGVMADLLTIDYSALSDFRLVGVDLDPESLALAEDFSRQNNLRNKCEFIKGDAWHLPFQSEFDIVISLGLNFYSPSVEAALELYRSLYQTVKPAGRLIVTYSTPMLGDPRSERDPAFTTPEDMKLGKLMAEVVQGKYLSNVNTSEDIVQHLKSVGFSSVSCHFSRYKATNIACAVK